MSGRSAMLSAKLGDYESDYAEQVRTAEQKCEQARQCVSDDDRRAAAATADRALDAAKVPPRRPRHARTAP